MIIKQIFALGFTKINDKDLPVDVARISVGKRDIQQKFT